MAESKTCPWCAEEINAAAKKCKHCGEFLEGAPAQTPTAIPSSSTRHVCPTCQHQSATSRDLYLHRVNTHGEFETNPGKREALRAPDARPDPDSKIVCPHCGERGNVTTKRVKLKKGISGSKATAAVLTLGYSILRTGLSRKETATEAHCGSCAVTWTM